MAACRVQPVESSPPGLRPTTVLGRVNTNVRTISVPLGIVCNTIKADVDFCSDPFPTSVQARLSLHGLELDGPCWNVRQNDPLATVGRPLVGAAAANLTLFAHSLPHLTPLIPFQSGTRARES
jgi:hypothetical protein